MRLCCSGLESETVGLQCDLGGGAAGKLASAGKEQQKILCDSDGITQIFEVVGIQRLVGEATIGHGGQQNQN